MRRTKDTRERLLAAALDLIWTNSYGAVGVEQICERAGVHKGSFYHFFPSKADLTLSAWEEHWQGLQPLFEEVFSPAVPPLERLRRWCSEVYRVQREKHAEYGFVCGCPFANLGNELGTQDARLRAKADECMAHGRQYLERAVSEAQERGEIAAGDPYQLAETVHACALGLLVTARVQNNPEVLRDLAPAVFRLLGAPPSSLLVPALPTSEPTSVPQTVPLSA